MFDLVIRDALILDGTGAPGRRGDLAVSGGRIAGFETGPAREVVEAGGLALMPGIIDGHTHYDAQITWDPYADPSPSLGVTTVVIGNCGFTIAPCRPADRDLTMRNLTHVEGMSLEALQTGIRWDFESFPDYLDSLSRRGVVPNVAAYVGHSSVRTYVLGPDASSRAATDAEIAQMRAIVLDAVAAGAVGFASSTNEPHNGEGGVPMPSRLADEREMRALVGALGEAGRGVFMLTKGSGTTVPFLEELAAESGRPVVVAALLHDATRPQAASGDLDAMRAARGRGRRLTGQVSCCPLTMEFTLRSPYVFEDLAAWRPAMAAKQADLPRLYADPGFRDAVRAEFQRPVRRLFNGQWHRIAVSAVVREGNRPFEGRTVDLLAAEAGKHPLDWLLNLALAEDLDTLFTAELKNADTEAVARLIGDPDSHIALSDAGAHLTFLCDADFGLNLLGPWSRDRGVMPLEQAVRRLTSQPADLFGIRGRGRLVPGAAADLLLFDPATVGRGPKVRVFDLPAGAARLTTAGQGVRGVWVNGVRVADETGPVAGAGRPGTVIRDFSA